MGLPCKYFVAGGHCKYGDSCRFDHPARAAGDGVSAGSSSSASASASVPRAAPEPALPSAGDLFAAHDDFEEATRPPPPSSWAGIFVPPDAALAAWEAAEAAEAQAADDEAAAAAAAAASFGGLTIIDDDEERFQNSGPLSGPSSSSLLPAAAGGGEGSGVGAAAAAPSPSSSSATDCGLCGQWAASGTCSRGDRCHLPHGEPCETCGRNALHPRDQSLRAAHAAECRARADRLAEVAASAAVECAICLERVLSKEGCRPSDRRFGLLEGCSHAFCLPCIRSWRGQANEQQAAAAAGPNQQQQPSQNQIDVATSLRTCPLCRTPAWFVTPSATWPRDDAARRAIVEAYRRSLARIECRWWDRGRGGCPFGTSCFYLHVDADGKEVARGEGLRFVGDGEGVVKPISQGAKLSDFIEFAVVKQRGRGGGGRR